MGNSESKSRPLEQWTKDDVADSVVSLGGPKYKEYAASIRDSGIDGGLLSSLGDDASELEEMLDELEISSKIHRKVIARALESSLLDQEKTDKSAPTTPVVETNNTDDCKQEEKVSTESSIPPNQDVPDFLAAEEYDLTAYTPISEIQEFDGLARQLMGSNSSANYAGVHLCRLDGQHVLCGNLRGPNGELIPMDRGTVVDHNQSFCSQLVLDKSKDFVIREVTIEDFRSIGSTYVGHVIKNDDGSRLGVVCQITTDTYEESQREEESLRLLSAEIAAMTEQQLRLRKQLQDRNKSLTEQVANARKEYMDLKSKEEEEKSSKSEQNVPPQVDDGPKSSKSEQNVPPHVDDGPTSNSSLLPFVANQYRASELERQHIPSSVFEEAAKAGMPPPPVGRDDMARVSRVEALGLHKMDPDSPMAKQLKGLVGRTASLFRFPVVAITIHNHSNQLALGIQDGGVGVIQAGETICSDSEGAPFCVAYGRGTTACNYTIMKRGTFVVPDLWKDEAFMSCYTGSPMRSYVGTPIITSDGYVVAVLCMLDTVPRHDFTKDHELELERMALLMAQTIENWEHRRIMDELVEERKLLKHLTSTMSLRESKRDAPSGEVTIVLTDIQGSTSLWEADADAMKEALGLHDKILRKCISAHSGYEIKTEGDAFHLAFHDPVDAIGFALEAQMELYKADWSDSILALADAGIDEEGRFRGLRVRMGIHHGSATPQINEVSGRASYSGKTFRLAKSIEALCFGGQILATAETWRVVSELSEQLGTPQVVDYGEYVLMTGEFMDEGIIAKGVVQLVPKELAYDYFNATGSTSHASLVPARGRRFPQADTTRRLTTSFLDAPDKSGTATMMFVYPSGTDDFADDLAQRTFSILTKVVRSLLLQVSPPGYECQEDKGKWVIAFESLDPAVKFGLMLMTAVGNAPFDDEVDTTNLIRVGIHSGAFSGMAPHPLTGRADYVGPVVNRAARVAAATDAGKVFVGVPVVESAEMPPPPTMDSEVSVEFVCAKELKGVSCKMALFCCEDKASKGRVARMLKKPRSDGNKGRKAKHTSEGAKPKRSFLGSLRIRKSKR